MDLRWHLWSVEDGSHIDKVRGCLSGTHRDPDLPARFATTLPTGYGIYQHQSAVPTSERYHESPGRTFQLVFLVLPHV